MRLGVVAFFYMRVSVGCKLHSLLVIFSLTELVNVFVKSDCFKLLDMKSNKILHCELLHLARCTFCLVLSV